MTGIILVALLALLVPLTVSAAEMPTIGREVGQVHPQIVLPGLDGKQTLALSGFRGKKVILIEFASW